MKYVIIIGIALVALKFAYGYFFNHEAGMVFDKNDPALNDAKRLARSSLPHFWKTLEESKPGTDEFLLKFNLNHQEPDMECESIWARVVSWDNGAVIAALGNDPVSEKYHIDQEVEVDLASIDDWSYFENDIAQGHFTTRAMIKLAPERMAKMQREALNWTDEIPPIDKYS